MPYIFHQGVLSEKGLDDAYANAAILVYPSLCEGFGLPILEAMTRNTPVVCSRIPAHIEVGGDAALFFDPYDPADLAQKLKAVLASKDLSNKLRISGAQNAKRFTWKATAEATVAVYASLTESARNG